MSTAIEAWGSAQGDATGDQPVLEDEIVGGEGEAYGEEPMPAEQDAGLESTLDEDAARKKKGMQTIMIAAGVSVVLLVGVVGFGVMKSRANAAPQLEIAPGVQAAVQAPAQNVATPMAGAASGAEAMATERLDGSPVPTIPAPQGPDFGLQASPGVADAPVVATAPAHTPAAPVLAPMPTNGMPKVAPAPALEVAPATPATPDLGKRAPMTAAAPINELKPDPQMVAELERLRSDLASARSEISKRDESIQRMQGEMSKALAKLEARPAPVRVQRVQAAPVVKVAPAKPAEVAAPAAEVVSAAQVAAPVAAKGKVRTDFRIYAAVDGRVWVMGPDGEPTQIGSRSPLSDGTRVTGIDTEKNVVFTTAGEIR